MGWSQIAQGLILAALPAIGYGIKKWVQLREEREKQSDMVDKIIQSHDKKAINILVDDSVHKLGVRSDPLQGYNKRPGNPSNN